MRRTLTLLALSACANVFISAPAVAQVAPEVTLTRLDCGTPVLNDVGVRFTDTYAYNGLNR